MLRAVFDRGLFTAGSVSALYLDVIKATAVENDRQVVGTASVDVLLSGVGTATIDGVIDAREWAGAGRAVFPVNLIGGGTTPGTLFVMNDAVNLYLAVEFNADAPERNSASFEFDNDHDGVWPENGDDTLSFHPGFGFFDGVRTNASPCPPNRSSGACGFEDSDSRLLPSDVTTVGGTNDGAGGFSNAGGVTRYEFSQPLDSADDASDFTLGPGDTVGFMLRITLGDKPLVFPLWVPWRFLVYPEDDVVDSYFPTPGCCDEGVHNGWLDIEVDSEHDVRGVIPPSMRDRARIVEVRRFTANEVRDLHD